MLAALPRAVRLEFPDPVNEVAARLVAAGVIVMATAALVPGMRWLLFPLAYGFVARVLAGPRFSPLGRLVTGVIVPRLSWAPKFVPGPPKRFAQGIGAMLTVAATVLYFVFGLTTATVALLVLLLVAASLESFFGICLGCKIFAALMRIGLLPETACRSCADLRLSRTP